MTRRRGDAAPAAPVLIGPGNALAALGADWRWAADTAARLGVPFVGSGKKRFLVASEFLAALRRAGITPGDEQPDETVDAATERLRELVTRGAA